MYSYDRTKIGVASMSVGEWYQLNTKGPEDIYIFVRSSKDNGYECLRIAIKGDRSKPSRKVTIEPKDFKDYTFVLTGDVPPEVRARIHTRNP